MRRIESMQRNLQKEGVLEFLLSGSAILTVKNNETGNHKTFRLTQTERGDAWFVSIRGDVDKDPRLKDKKNWLYMGLLNEKKEFFTTRGSKVGRDSVSFRSFQWLLKAATEWELGQDQYPNVEVYHEGYCGRCGRTLTDPQSIERGFGPECAKKVGGC
jgi:hypothetical protein